ncbi:hypothetical protein BB561_002214 [Smittium simulii]|uniref:Uncharacterized protein n=1 Tax=Smittium simulii TaxID=133385 RepID=A0A2T9YR72_9FUNG|nr:hypothetical protein BB561_002214 [Smittium simulii]
MEFDSPSLRYDSSDESEISDSASQKVIQSKATVNNSEHTFIVQKTNCFQKSISCNVNIYLDPDFINTKTLPESSSLYAIIFSPNYSSTKTKVLPSALAHLRKFYTEAVSQSAITLGLAASIINFSELRSIPVFLNRNHNEYTNTNTLNDTNPLINSAGNDSMFT